MLNAETKRHIDAARDVLVGVAPNPMTQIDQITYALIYKFMDDMDQAAIKAGGEPSFFTGELEPYAWSKLVDTRMGNQEKMNLYGEALQKFAEAKQLPELFRTIFRSAFLPYRSPETLGLFLKEINFFDYTHPEELGNVYEYLLSIMSAQGDAGQFRTPRHIIDFIVDVINPTKDDTVLDPACGTGGFLVSSYNHILEQHDGKNDPSKKEKPLTPDERRKLMNNFEGYDIDPTMVRIAQVNMYLHQFKNPKIYQYDSLTSEERWNDKFDVILANPPFMSPKGGIKPHNKFALQSNRSEVLFVDYIANHLKPNGRAGIIVPEGIIFQSGKAYKQLRKELVEGGLYAVVSLPAGVFNPYSGVKTSVLLINNEIAKQREEILFVKISADGYDLGATKRKIEKNDLSEALDVLNTWSQGGNPSSSLCSIVTRQALLLSSDVNLASDRHLASKVSSSSEWPVARLGDLLSVQNGFAFDSSKFNNSLKGVPIIRIRDVNSGFSNTYFDGKFDSKYLVHNGDLLIGMDGDFRSKIWLDGDALLNQRVCRLYDFKNVKKEYVHYLIQSKLDEIHSSTFAVTVKHLSSKQIEAIEIPLPPLDVQEQIVSELDSYAAIIEGAKKIFENWKPRIDVDPKWGRLPLNEVAQIEWGNTNLTKSAYSEFGKYLGVSAAGADGRMDLAEHQVGVTVLSAIGANCGRVFYPNEPFTAIKNTMTFTPKTERLNPKFLFYIMSQNSLPRRGGGQPFITKGDVQDYEIPVPSVARQAELVAEMEKQESAVSASAELAADLEKRISEAIRRLWKD